MTKEHTKHYANRVNNTCDMCNCSSVVVLTSQDGAIRNGDEARCLVCKDDVSGYVVLNGTKNDDGIDGYDICWSDANGNSVRV